MRDVRRPTAATSRRAAGCLAVSAVLTALTALLAPAGWFERVDGVLTDLAFPRGTPDPSVAVVGIDARALTEVDSSWPWTRDRYAELLERLDAAGAEVVALDVVLAAPGEGDAELVEAMGSVPTVLAAASSTARTPDGEPLKVVPTAVPLEEIASAAAGVGHAQVVADPADGVVRTVPAVVEAPDLRLVPSLSLAALAARDGIDAAPILRRPSGVQLGNRLIPTDDRYRVRISWPEGSPRTRPASVPTSPLRTWSRATSTPTPSGAGWSSSASPTRRSATTSPRRSPSGSPTPA